MSISKEKHRITTRLTKQIRDIEITNKKGREREIGQSDLCV